MRRARGDSGAVQVAVVVVALVAAVGAGAAGVVTQRALRDEGPGSADEVGADARGTFAAVDCTGEVVVGELHGGDRIFVTARAADGDLVRIRNPIDPDETWWVAASVVDPDDELGALPEVSCDEPDPDEPGDEVAAGDPEGTSPDVSTETTEPGDDEDADDEDESGDDPATEPDDPAAPTTTRRAGPTTTSAPGPTTPSPTSPPPTQPPDTAGPSLSVSASEPHIYEEFPGLCMGEPRTSTLTAIASDPSGVSQVQATWSFVGKSGLVQGSATLTGGGTRTGTFGPYGYGTLPSGTQKAVQVSIVATDGLGNSSSPKTVTITLHSADQCFG